MILTGVVQLVPERFDHWLQHEPDMKAGDVVRLKENIEVPGALTAIKFYRRLNNEVKDNYMLVLKVHGKSATVLISGYRKVLNLELIEKVNE